MTDQILQIKLKDVIKSARSKNYFNNYYGIKQYIMIPALKKNTIKVIFPNGEDVKEIYREEYEYKDEDSDITYVLTPGIYKDGKYHYGLSEEEIKHMLHCIEYKIYSDEFESRYIKIYMGR